MMQNLSTADNVSFTVQKKTACFSIFGPAIPPPPLIFLFFYDLGQQN